MMQRFKYIGGAFILAGVVGGASIAHANGVTAGDGQAAQSQEQRVAGYRCFLVPVKGSPHPRKVCYRTPSWG